MKFIYMDELKDRWRYYFTEFEISAEEDLDGKVIYCL